MLALFTDGTETSSTAISYAMYELALNPHCQQKAFDELTRVISKYDGKITVEGLQEMIYIEGILHEAIRMHSPLIVMAKMCTQRYTLPKTSEQSEPVTINPGTSVNINVGEIHMLVNSNDNFHFFFFYYTFNKKRLELIYFS